MKHLAQIILTALLVIACKNNANQNVQDNTKTQESINASLEGTWELVGFYNYINNKVSDSFNPSTGYRQVKMYTSTKVMWSKNVPTDSTEWFGYGYYNINGDTLTEVLDYGSKMMKKIINERKEFKYELSLKENTFSQIEVDDEGNRIYSENYKRIE
ncbi:hypothetical protein DMZ43_09250 [Meridianimaribacter sp. CL38]|uniref:hypothetical protein n=1 Tax=Meridianimaribacter sp. CL38 TaxID=2213021 RepID=UPI00103CEC11|nr:hypothetical protein [Meridianimaribacter sp. CL38]TBV26079.1 hypothetical protein DMZ43_09250 [Meridianimaribacter sp. CL38]